MFCQLYSFVILTITFSTANLAEGLHRQKRQFQRFNLGALLNSLSPQPNQPVNNDIGNIIGSILQNSDISFNISPQGQLEVGLGKNQSQFGSQGGSSGQTNFSGNSGTFFGNCQEENVEYYGDDLQIRRNGFRNKVNSFTECQQDCQRTSGCNFFVFYGFQTPNRRLRNSCFLKKNKVASGQVVGVTSGPVVCPGNSNGNFGGSGSIGGGCLTTGGGTIGVPCVFPFIFKGVRYNGCTLAEANDGIPWCSTQVNAIGEHVGGQGKWGQCPSECPNDFIGSNVNTGISTFPTTTSTTTTTTTTTAQIFNPLKACGTNAKKFQTRIVGGQNADTDEWPWLVALIRPSAGSESSGQYCGATLISDFFVVTAAHCIAPFQANQIQAKLGEYNFNENSESLDSTYGIAYMKMHESYNPKTFANDIALIKLDRRVTINKSVYPICLPPRGELFTNRRAYVIGWGTIYFGGPSSTTVQEVNVRVWENDKCSESYGKLSRTVEKTMLCAGEQGRDACQGDSGGPLNCLNELGRWELCGIVSWGARCAEPEFPGVYTRVTEFLDWISINAI